MITKQFISQWNFRRPRGSVGRAHVHVGYIFLNINEEIVVRNPKSKIFFIVYSLLSCLLCIILQFINISHLSKSLSSILSLHDFRGLRVSFGARYCFTACWLPLYNLIMVHIVHHSRHLLRARTFKIACAVTRILYRVRDSNLTGLRSKSQPIKHFYSQREECAVKIKCE